MIHVLIIAQFQSDGCGLNSNDAAAIQESFGLLAASRLTILEMGGHLLFTTVL